MKPNFQNILVDMLREKYPNTKFSIEGDKVTSDDNQFVAIADLTEEEGYGGVWVWDVDTGPYRGVLGNAIQEATTQFIKQNPSLKPALFVDGDNQNPEAWTAIAAKLGYTLIDEDFDFDEDTGNVETNSSMSTPTTSPTPSPTPSPTSSTPATRATGLGQGIRSAMAGGNISTNSVGTRSLGVAASNMAKNLQDNTDAIQKIIDAGDEETKKELAKLIKMMSDAQRMRGERQTAAIRDVVSQVKVLSETSVDLANALDLKQTLKDLKPGSIGSRIQESLNVDQGAGFFGTIKQAFEPSRMFQGGSFFGLGRERFARINQEREFMARRQLASATGGLSSAVGSLSLDEPTPASTLGTAPQATGRFQSGLDVLGEPERQTRLLEDILKELEKMNENGITSPAGAGILSSILGGAVGAKLAGVATTLGRAVVTLARIGTTVGLAATALYGVKKLFDATNRGAQERFEDDIIPGRPNIQYNAARRQLLADLGRPPTEQEMADFLEEAGNNVIPGREGDVAPEELSIEEQNLNNVMEEFEEIERQQEVINSMTPEQQEVFNSMTPEQQEAYFSDTTPTLGNIELPAGVALGDGVDFTGPLGQTGEANNVIVEGTANGQIIKTTNGSFRVTDPISGKQVDFPSEEFAQKALDGEYNYETGKFIDRYKDPDSYDPDVLDSSRLKTSEVSEENLQASIVRTSDAMYKVGGAGQHTNLGGTTVINNNTTNNTTASPSSQIAIAIDAAGARSNSHTLKRKEDMRFMA